MSYSSAFDAFGTGVSQLGTAMKGTGSRVLKSKNFWIGFLAFLVIILGITLTLVWTDYAWGWGMLRKAYPGEECKTNDDCLDGLVCRSDKLCACAGSAPPPPPPPPPPT